MFKGTLFERLLDIDKYDDSDYNENNHKVLIASVVFNISNILSTRTGSSSSSADYGIPDLNNIDLSVYESFLYILEQIEATIKKYEPRMLHVDVKGEKQQNIGSSKLKLNISGLIMFHDEKININLQASIKGDGSVKVDQYEEV